MAYPMGEESSPAAAGKARHGVKFKLDRNVVISAGLRLLPMLDRILMPFAATKEHQVFPNELFPWTSLLAANWPVIRDEAQALLRDPMSIPSVRELSSDHEKIAVDDKWRSFFFWGYGLRSKAN